MRRHLAEFVECAWHVIEPDVELTWNWHLDAICEHLEAVTRGEIRRLIINIPPGHMKSLLVSVFWPAWQWLHNPGWRVLAGSYAMDLALRDNQRARELIESEWYRTTFVPEWELAGDQNVKSRFKTTAQGERLACSVGGRVTGFRGDCIIIDDPLGAQQAESEATRRKAIDWFGKAVSTRLNDARKGSIVVIMQRLHEEDLTGHLLQGAGWDHLCLPSEYDPARPSVTSIGWRDPREEVGELLFPERFPQEVLDELKSPTMLGARGYAGQHQQLPTPQEGDIFKREWWNYWSALPQRFDMVIQSWDCTFKDTDTSDYVVGQVWGRKGASFYLLDQVRARMSFGATRDAINVMAAKWPDATAIYIEDKANGSAIISELKRTLPGVIGVSPEGGKEARANAVSPLLEAGNVFIPKASPWTGALVEECAAFPNGRHDDQVDAMTQALLRLRHNPLPTIKGRIHTRKR